MTDSGCKDGQLSFPPDCLAKRLLVGLVVSIFANALLWAGASVAVRFVPRHDFKTIEITRMVVNSKGRMQEKVVTKKEIQKKVAIAKKEIQRKIITRSMPSPVRKVAMQPTPMPKPEGAHNRVLTALPTRDSANLPSDTHQVLSGGNASVGQAIGQQNVGNAVKNPVAQTPAPTPAPAPAPHAVVAQQAAPEEAPKPRVVPKGPTKDAEAVSTVQPDIPDNLKQQEFKTFVRVRVRVAADGSFQVTLRTSSGNSDIDKRVLNALNKWRWKPALRDGSPVDSTQLFKFEFEVK
jgi:TonB family protein